MCGGSLQPQAEAPPSFTVTSTIAGMKPSLADTMKPRDLTAMLDKQIVGQAEAKRAVSIALRNRWRRQQLGDDLKKEVIPKNILMIGPTGCGKTEIARRIAKLSQAPFIKVEATKYTEVGFHGKDVDQIIKDLLDISINMTRKRMRDELRSTANETVDEIIVRAIAGDDVGQRNKEEMLVKLRAGELDDVTIKVDVPVAQAKPSHNPLGGFPMEGMPFTIIGGGAELGGRNRRTETTSQELKVKDAKAALLDSKVDELIEESDVIKEAITSVEESGIVFIDEIDKIVSTGDYRGADASSEGVQRDLLPLIEGTTISTKHGNVETDHILFIASGAFHEAKPSDLLAELQGRLPIRVTLKGLTEEDMYKILTEPVHNLIRQQVELMKTENVELEFTPEAVKEIARVAFVTNRTVENIGARRLHTIIERVMEDTSYQAPEMVGQRVVITDAYVQQKVNDLLLSSDMRKFII